jgi:hypothetical protein
VPQRSSENSSVVMATLLLRFGERSFCNRFEKCSVLD